jgi:hypothetical protein
VLALSNAAPGAVLELGSAATVHGVLIKDGWTWFINTADYGHERSKVSSRRISGVAGSPMMAQAVPWGLCGCLWNVGEDQDEAEGPN